MKPNQTPLTKEQEIGFFEQVTASFVINKYPQYSLQSFLSEISTHKSLRNEFAEYLNNVHSQAILNERSRVVKKAVRIVKEGYYQDITIKYIKALSNPTTLDTVNEGEK